MSKILLKGRPYGGSTTVTDALHLLTKDTLNTDISAQNMLSNILGDMAQLETSTAATKAYAKGEYLVLGSYFYKVTATIDPGDTLTVGTNIERTNVGAEMSGSYELVDGIEITSHSSSSNPYTVPCDGYVHVWANNANSAVSFYIKASTGPALATQVLGTAAHMTIFVKKGFQVWGAGQNNGGLRFWALKRV